MNTRLTLAYLRLVLMAVAVTLLLLSGGVLTQAMAITNLDGSPAWANPSVTAMKRIGAAPSTLGQPNFQSNLDCTRTTYRQVSDKTMQTGCFMSAAYGAIDPDSGMIIFNATDEGLSIHPYTSQQILTPWPGSEDVLALSSAMTAGTYISIYRNLTSVLKDQRNILGQLVAKDVTAPPDLVLNNVDGSKMIINPQTVAFSSNSSWLVVETLTGSFVRINLATLDMTAFAPAYGSQGSPALLKSQVSISNSGRYVSIQNDVAGSFKVYDLSSCQGDKTLISPLACDFHEYLPFVNTQISGLKIIRHLRFINEELLSFVADYSGGSDVFELSPKIDISSSLNYLALGDSYTSGEGAFDYLSGTDNSVNSCHLSLNSYPLLITRLLYGTTGGHSVACSGAKITDAMPVSSATYKGQVIGGATIDNKSQILADFMPGYLAQSAFVTQYQPGTITVSVGGNDIGFSDILKNCILPHLTLHFSDSVCYNTYEDRLEVVDLIDRTVPKWTSLFRNLITSSPVSKVYAIGYPQIFDDRGKCPINVQLSKSELEFSAEITSYIDGAIQQAAFAAGVNYVDISQAFFGYRLCETSNYEIAVNGLTAGKDSGILGLQIFGNESYHPNSFGHYLLKNMILDKTNNFSGVVDSSVSDRNSISKTLLNVPSSGRKIYTLLPSENIGQSVIDKSNAVKASVDGADYGLKPNTTYSLSLDRGQTSLADTVQSDFLGNISASFVVPNVTTTGIHSLDVIGANQIGETVDIRQSVYVSFSAQDIDGDGIINIEDSCVGEINSGIDADGDNIDDVCDSFIGPSSNSSGTSSGILSDGSSPSDTNTSLPGPAPYNLDNESTLPVTQHTLTPDDPVGSSLVMPANNSLKHQDKPLSTSQSVSYRNLQPTTWPIILIKMMIIALLALIFWVTQKLASRFKLNYRNIYRWRKKVTMIS